jgi:hypothetical protein
MQLPFATRHAFSNNHPATYKAVLVLVLAKASLRMTGAKRDSRRPEWEHHSESGDQGELP